MEQIIIIYPLETKGIKNRIQEKRNRNFRKQGKKMDATLEMAMPKQLGDEMEMNVILPTEKKEYNSVDQKHKGRKLQQRYPIK